MSYTPPNGLATDFSLQVYTPPGGLEADFQFQDGVTVKIKISGTFQDKPMMIKIAGTFTQVKSMTKY